MNLLIMDLAINIAFHKVRHYHHHCHKITLIQPNTSTWLLLKKSNSTEISRHSKEERKDRVCSLWEISCCCHPYHHPKTVVKWICKVIPGMINKIEIINSPSMQDHVEEEPPHFLSFVWTIDKGGVHGKRTGTWDLSMPNGVICEEAKLKERSISFSHHHYYHPAPDYWVQ